MKHFLGTPLQQIQHYRLSQETQQRHHHNVLQRAFPQGINTLLHVRNRYHILITTRGKKKTDFA
jgi:hypothetical protein